MSREELKEKLGYLIAIMGELGIDCLWAYELRRECESYGLKKPMSPDEIRTTLKYYDSVNEMGQFIKGQIAIEKHYEKSRKLQELIEDLTKHPANSSMTIATSLNVKKNKNSN